MAKGGLLTMSGGSWKNWWKGVFLRDEMIDIGFERETLAHRVKKNG